MSRHTSTPWALTDRYLRDPKTGAAIAQIFEMADGKNNEQLKIESQENIRFIYNAVNSHERLISAAKNCVELLSMIAEVICKNNPPPDSLKYLKEAREAIAQAEALP